MVLFFVSWIFSKIVCVLRRKLNSWIIKAYLLLGFSHISRVTEDWRIHHCSGTWWIYSTPCPGPDVWYETVYLTCQPRGSPGLYVHHGKTQGSGTYEHCHNSTYSPTHPDGKYSMVNIINSVWSILLHIGSNACHNKIAESGLVNNITKNDVSSVEESYPYCYFACSMVYMVLIVVTCLNGYGVSDYPNWMYRWRQFICIYCMHNKGTPLAFNTFKHKQYINIPSIWVWNIFRILKLK